MVRDKSSKKTFLLLLFMAVYFTSYLTRNNFATIVVAVSEQLSLSRSALSICFTGSFITYGAGQIISGYLGDKIKPKQLVFFGLLTTTAVNFLITLCHEAWVMAVLWSINGLAQAFLWPPLVKLVSELFSDREYKKAIVYVNYGGLIGTITLYFVSPWILSLSDWRGVFITAAVCGVIVIFLWQIFCPDPKKNDETPLKNISENGEKGNSESLRGLLKYGSVLGLIMLAIVLHGALRDGVTTWAPSYVSEVFNLENEIAILVSVVLPIFGFISYGFSGWLYSNHVRNPIVCALIFFCAGLTSAIGLLLFRGRIAVLDVALLALFVASMHGVNLMFTGMIPAYFAHVGRISFVSGLLNACTYIGSAISTYGIAVLSEKAGWTITISCWAIIAAVGLAACCICLPLWKKKIVNDTSKKAISSN